jgi:hypothetical protein
MRRRTAASILEEHATADDIATIRDYLSREGLGRDTSDMYVVCDLITALSRHPDQGPYDELRPIFCEIPSSYGRRFIAAVLAPPLRPSAKLRRATGDHGCRLGRGRRRPARTRRGTA